MSIVNRFLYKLLKKTKLTSKFLGLGILNNRRSYLGQRGWFRSIYEGLPMDSEGNPLPWYCYPSIEYIDKKIKKNMKVFEYGSGNSTLWWGSRVEKVVSCEHHEEWHSLMKPKLPGNVNYLLVDLEPDGEYCRSALSSNEVYDIIVIDGRDRVNCSKNCVDALAENGIIIWDNSEREKYEEGYNYLLKNGFKRLDFFGMGPIVHYGWMTSIFYRNENCFDI